MSLPVSVFRRGDVERLHADDGKRHRQPRRAGQDRAGDQREAERQRQPGDDQAVPGEELVVVHRVGAGGVGPPAGLVVIVDSLHDREILVLQEL